MKCPYCGAEATGRFCSYCGSELPKEKPNIHIEHNETIINNYGFPDSGKDNVSKSIEDKLIEQVKIIHKRYPDKEVKAIKALREYIGFDKIGLVDAKAIMDAEYTGKDLQYIVPSIINKLDSFYLEEMMRNEAKISIAKEEKRQRELQEGRERNRKFFLWLVVIAILAIYVLSKY